MCALLNATELADTADQANLIPVRILPNSHKVNMLGDNTQRPNLSYSSYEATALCMWTLTDMKAPYDLSLPNRRLARAARSFDWTLAWEEGGMRVRPTAPCMKEVSPRNTAASSWPEDVSSAGPSAVSQQ